MAAPRFYQLSREEDDDVWMCIMIGSGMVGHTHHPVPSKACPLPPSHAPSQLARLDDNDFEGDLYTLSQHSMVNFNAADNPKLVGEGGGGAGVGGGWGGVRGWMHVRGGTAPPVPCWHSPRPTAIACAQITSVRRHAQTQCCTLCSCSVAWFRWVCCTPTASTSSTPGWACPAHKRWPTGGPTCRRPCEPLANGPPDAEGLRSRCSNSGGSGAAARHCCWLTPALGRYRRGARRWRLRPAAGRRRHQTSPCPRVPQLHSCTAL